MSYHSELMQELREENARLQEKVEKYGGLDSEDIYKAKGVRYFSLNQVEIPVDTIVSAIYGVNRQAEREIIKAIDAALTVEQRLFLDEATTLPDAEEATIEQPAGETVPLDMVALAAQVAGIEARQ